MSGHLVRLEAANLIERKRATDRRRIGLYLTPEGAKVLRSVRSKRTAWLAARLERSSRTSANASRTPSTPWRS